MTDNDEDADMSLGKVLKYINRYNSVGKTFLKMRPNYIFHQFLGSIDSGDPKNVGLWIVERFRQAKNSRKLNLNMDYFFQFFEK